MLCHSQSVRSILHTWSVNYCAGHLVGDIAVAEVSCPSLQWDKGWYQRYVLLIYWDLFLPLI